ELGRRHHVAFVVQDFVLPARALEGNGDSLARRKLCATGALLRDERQRGEREKHDNSNAHATRCHATANDPPDSTHRASVRHSKGWPEDTTGPEGVEVLPPSPLRHPETSIFREVIAARRDADDDERLAVETNQRAYNAWIASEALLPQPLAQQHDIGSGRH